VLAATVSGMIVQWDRETGSEINRFTGHDGGVWSVTLSPDEKQIASSDDTGTIILWDLENGTELRRHNAHNALSFQVAFSPDGATVYSVSADETLAAWQVGDLSLPALLSWIENNRYVRELTCEERAQYDIEPLCD
jgi:WD40 repeat protein